MQTIHKVVKVINNQVIIDMPPDFIANEVEVILKPLAHKDPAIHELEREIDIGMKSPISPKSHKEIMAKILNGSLHSELLQNPNTCKYNQP